MSNLGDEAAGCETCRPSAKQKLGLVRAARHDDGAADRQRSEGRPSLGGAGSAAALTSAAVLGGRREVIIVHGSERYRLRLTANDKLILTK